MFWPGSTVLVVVRVAPIRTLPIPKPAVLHRRVEDADVFIRKKWRANPTGPLQVTQGHPVFLERVTVSTSFTREQPQSRFYPHKTLERRI